MKQNAQVISTPSLILSPFDRNFDPSRYSKGKSHFQLAFCSIRDPLRKTALYDFYAFCRLTDDLADEEGFLTSERKRALLEISDWVNKRSLISHDYWDRFHRALEAFEVPREKLQGILKGVELDLQENFSYQSWDDLNQYVQGVACDVGAVVLHLLGAKSTELEDYARNMGRCVQYLNIMRDLEKDLREGRNYIPLEFLSQIGEDPASIQRSGITKIRQELFQRALEFRKQAKPYSSRCFPAELMVNLYVEAAKLYWRNGSERKLGRLQKLRVFGVGVYRSWAFLRKASS